MRNMQDIQDLKHEDALEYYKVSDETIRILIEKEKKRRELQLKISIHHLPLFLYNRFIVIALLLFSCFSIFLHLSAFVAQLIKNVPSPLIQPYVEDTSNFLQIDVQFCITMAIFALIVIAPFVLLLRCKRFWNYLNQSRDDFKNSITYFQDSALENDRDIEAILRSEEYAEIEKGFDTRGIDTRGKASFIINKLEELHGIKESYECLIRKGIATTHHEAVLRYAEEQRHKEELEIKRERNEIEKDRNRILENSEDSSSANSHTFNMNIDIGKNGFSGSFKDTAEGFDKFADAFIKLRDVFSGKTDNHK